MGTGGHNVPLIVCGRTENGDRLVRKLAPEEWLALRGYNRLSFKVPTTVSLNQVDKQVGNSVPVNVVNEVVKTLIKLL